jgi:outer membrane immunogenic protein
MFKKIVFVASVVVAFCGAAQAANMPTRTPVYTNPTPVSLWDGFYVGVHGGYASGDVDVLIGPAAGSGSPKGAFGGVHLGYNHLLTPNWLIGSEVDASFGDIDDAFTVAGATRYQVDTFGTARGRLGYVRGPWLLYATAGMAWAKPELTAAGVSTDRVHVGWAAGLGVEYMLLPSWSLKAEYLYADFGETQRSLVGIPIDTDLTMSMVRLGLNYHFGNFNNAARVSAMPVKAPIRSEARWTGAYVGVHGGYGSGDFENSLGAASNNLSPDGGFGGFQTGYNWRIGPAWVVGLESDSSWGSLKDRSGTSEVDIDAMGTVRGRLGYAMNNWLLYGTGGLAWAHVESETTTPVAATADQFMLGWTAGVGVEYEFMPRWSAKVEYAYADFGSVRDSAGGTVKDTLDAHTIKVGLNYHASLFGMLFNR